jgi:small subunit ribosomal protein S6
MATPPRVYDLLLVLSSAAEEDARAKVLSDVEAQITGAGGTVERQDDWHNRPLAYEINHQSEGEYHLLQFTGPASLLEPLGYNLRINDAVLRHRIIKVLPGTPPPPDSPPPVVASAAAGAGSVASPVAAGDDDDE